jgi:putative nucleotidyltransferase with HDIG domain
MNHTLQALKNVPPDLITRLGILFHDIAKPAVAQIINGEVRFFNHEMVGAEMTKEILTRLKYPNEIIDAVVIAVKNHMRGVGFGSEGMEITDKGLRKLQADLGQHLERVLDVINADSITLAPNKNAPNKVPTIRKRLSTLGDIRLQKPLPVNGTDIEKILNVKPGKGGKKVGQILASVREAWYENPNIDKTEALDIVYDWLQKHNGE